jgi:putative toxin-antitoxin system antitoxin component (TIGR02293 family)
MAILGAEDWRDTGTTAKLACARIGTGKLFELEQAGWLTAGEVIEYVLPKRTLTHRREKREPLSVEESDRLLRIARLTEQAVKTFGNEEKAKAWLRRPSPRFDGNSPLELTRTEHGGRVVEEALIQIDEGLFA